MHAERRAILWSSLRGHAPADAKEATDLMRMAAFALSRSDPFDRHADPVHFTASALVVSPRLDRVLLVHHRGLDRWLQPGGHVEAPDGSSLDAAMREAWEETGASGLAPHPGAIGLFDVDIHRVPKHDGPDHEHLDLRHLLVADPDPALRRDERETKDAKWFGWDEALDVAGKDLALARLFEKAMALRPKIRA